MTPNNPEKTILWNERQLGHGYNRRTTASCAGVPPDIRRGCETVKGYFVQAVDGEACYVPNLSHLGIASIESYLDPNIKADVILCNVSAEEVQGYMHPVRGAAEFLARRHPSSMVRQELLAMLHVYASARLNQCEHVSQPIH